MDDNSLFSVFQNTNSTATTDINSDLCKINDWAYEWKISFNPHPNEQTQKVFFSTKISEIDHSPLLFNQHLLISY